MVDFRSGYVPPGVYVSSDSTGSVAAVGVGGTVVCLVGRGLGYTTYSEAVSFSGGNDVTLTKSGVNASSVKITGSVSSGGTVSQATFVLDANGTPHDYSVTQTGSGTTSATVVHRTSTGSIPTTGVVLVTYQYTDDQYFALNTFSDYSDFENIYGTPFDPANGELLSPLSFAAQLAFQSGAPLVYAVALGSEANATTRFSNAYTKTQGNYDINVIVPLFEAAADSSTAQSLLAGLVGHLQGAEADGFRRLGIVGLSQDYDDPSGPDVLAQQITYRRVLLTWPPAFLYYNSTINSTQIVDGMYFAAATAGVLANQDINRGLTRSQIRGFAGIPASALAGMTSVKKNSWSSKGVAVAEVDRNGRLVIRHGVTTDVSSVENREASIVREDDAVFNLIQTSLVQADLIGDPITADTPFSIKAIIAGALETALTTGVIQGYQNLQVRQLQLPSGDPTVIQVTFDWLPTYPLNYITVVYTLDLTDGTVTTADTASGSSNATT